MIEKVCPHCKSIFMDWPCRPKIYCSRQCYAESKKSKHPEAMRVCRQCGKSFRTNPAYVKRRPDANIYCSRTCMWNYKRDHPSCYVDSLGYLNTRRGRIHRILMENHLGRTLGKEEIVHHINGNKQDNRIENLVVMTKSEHHKLHWRVPEFREKIVTRRWPAKA